MSLILKLKLGMAELDALALEEKRMFLWAVPMEETEETEAM